MVPESTYLPTSTHSAMQALAIARRHALSQVETVEHQALWPTRAPAPTDRGGPWLEAALSLVWGVMGGLAGRGSGCVGRRLLRWRTVPLGTSWSQWAAITGLAEGSRTKEREEVVGAV